MYLNLGSSVVIHQDDILGVFDLDNTAASRAELDGRVVSAGDGLPKSFLLCRDRQGTTRIYLSQLATATLLRRMESGGFELV